MKLFYDHDKTEAIEGQKEAAALLYDKCWVRAVDYSQVSEEKTEPEHFGRDELAVLLRQKAVVW